ncbi:MAG TPA: pyridoxamine 5'-phosphate oxidase family protein [Gemmatimonadaceae bacterium]|nr:pyridoxamine 5'-phosphate oxidase family protein [Gemmatimonadaceae bacterium]
MTAAPNVGPSQFLDTPMTTAECEALLRRACFGHLAFSTGRHADVRPIRYAYREDWVYFRADVGLRKIIAASPWLLLSATELQDPTRVSSVIVRGGCYEAESTGSTLGDAVALQGIMELRDRASVNPRRAPRVRRSSTVFRLHVDELRGVTAFVPCPAGGEQRG